MHDELKELIAPTIRYKRLFPEAREPKLATDGSSGYDIYVLRVLDKETGRIASNLEKPIKIEPGESVLFGTGIALEIPPTHHAVLASRSGLSMKYDMETGCPGAPIDSDYRGEFKVLLRNHRKKSFTVKKFGKIAQLLFEIRVKANLVEAKELSKTKRGKKGLGSTGLYEK